MTYDEMVEKWGEDYDEKLDELGLEWASSNDDIWIGKYLADIHDDDWFLEEGEFSFEKLKEMAEEIKKKLGISEEIKIFTGTRES
jgi:hypothetical protein